MDNSTPTSRDVGIVRVLHILRFFFRHVRQHRLIVRSTVLTLLERSDRDEERDTNRDGREIPYWLVAGLKVLMLGTVGDLQSTVFVPVEPQTVDDAETLAAQNVDRFFPMHVLSGMPTYRNFGFHYAAT